MSFKAADYTPPKLDLSEPTRLQPDTATNDRLRADAQPAKVETPGPNGAKGDVQLDPYAQAFNRLEVTPITPGAKTGDVITDPFDSRFNTIPKGDKTPQPGRSTTDGVLPEVTDPFAPKFSILPKPGDTGTSPQTLEVDPFDPFRDWSKVPGITKPIDGPPNANVDPFDPMSDWSKVPGLEPRPQPAAGPADKPVTPQDTPAKPADVVPKRPANPVFNEENVGDAIKLAQTQNQPIYVFSSPDGKLDQAQQAAMQANAGDAIFVNINFAHADQMMRAGLETTNYWQLANLCGAGGDVNNLYQKPGFIGRFSATDFNPQDPQNSLKAKATGDVQAVFAGQVKPPSPAPDAPQPGPTRPDAPQAGPPKDTPAQVEPKKDGPGAPTDQAPEKKGPVKLEQSKFDTSEIVKAFQVAKENNLPVILYKGADFCHNCPPVSGAIDRLAQDIKNAPTTDAVVLKLNYETIAQLQRTNPELANYVSKFFPPGTSVPAVSVYNPNDTSKPIPAPNGYGGDSNHLRRLIKAGQDAMGATPSRGLDQASPPQARRAEATPPGVFTENNVQAATKAARDKNVPMLSYLESAKAPNPNLAKAMQYLSENGLASTVKVSRPRAERMLQDGLESSKFYALKDAMLRTPDVARDGSSHLSAFAPANLNPGSRFAPSNCTEAAKSPDEIVKFLKDSGVDLSKNNSEAAVRALLEGKPVPPPPEPVKEKEKPATPAQPADAPAVPPQAKPADAPIAPPPGQPADAPSVTPQARPADAPVVPPQAVQPEVKKPAIVNPEPEVTPARAPDQPPAQPDSTPIRPAARPADATPVQPPAQPEAAPVQPAVQPTAQPEAPRVQLPTNVPEDSWLHPVLLPEVPPVQPAVRPPETTPVVPQVREKEATSDATPVKPEGTEAQAKTQFKVKTAEEALKVIEDAKKRNLDLVVYSPTVICTDQSCTMTKLDTTNPGSFGDKAIFLELPRGGVSVPAGAEYDALREMNQRHAVTNEDHKKELDLHVYSFNKDKSAYELNDGPAGTRKGTIAGSNFDASTFLRARLAKKSK